MPVFGSLQPLPGNFWSNDVTYQSLLVSRGLVTSFPLTRLPPPASYSLVGSEMYSICEFSTHYSHFQVTSSPMTSLPGHLWSRDVNSCHVTASSCELQPCSKWNVQYMALLCFLQPLPGDLSSIHVTCGLIPVT